MASQKELNEQLVQYSQDPKLVEFIPAAVQAGADINHTVDGKNMLHVAADAGNAAAIPVLIDLKIPVDSKATAEYSEGWTAAHFAAVTDDVSMLKALQAKGANLFAQDELGETPLHLTVVAGAPEAAKFLADIGTKEQIHILNNSGDTAISQFEKMQKDNDGVEILENQHQATINIYPRVNAKLEPSLQMLPGENMEQYLDRKSSELPEPHRKVLKEAGEIFIKIAENLQEAKDAGATQTEIRDAVKKGETEALRDRTKKGRTI